MCMYMYMYTIVYKIKKTIYNVHVYVNPSQLHVYKGTALSGIKLKTCLLQVHSVHYSFHDGVVFIAIDAI